MQHLTPSGPDRVRATSPAPRQAEMENEELQIRFRHTLGDVGPISFADSSSIASVKEIVFGRWPTGELSWLRRAGRRRQRGGSNSQPMPSSPVGDAPAFLLQTALLPRRCRRQPRTFESCAPGSSWTTARRSQVRARRGVLLQLLLQLSMLLIRLHNALTSLPRRATPPRTAGRLSQADGQPGAAGSRHHARAGAAAHGRQGSRCAGAGGGASTGGGGSAALAAAWWNGCWRLTD